MDGERARTLAPVDIHAGVTTQSRVYSGDPESSSLTYSHWTWRFSLPLLLGVISADYLCPKIRQFARPMPQIVHRSKQSDRCSQAYPQKMGIDNSRAEDVCRTIRREFRFGIIDIIMEGAANESESSNRRTAVEGEKGGRSTHLPRVIGTVETLGGL
jgi:hypothetical protein